LNYHARLHIVILADDLDKNQNNPDFDTPTTVYIACHHETLIIVCTGGYSAVHTFNNKKVTAQDLRNAEDEMTVGNLLEYI